MAAERSSEPFLTRTETYNDRVLLSAPFGTAIVLGQDLCFELANERFCRMLRSKDLAGKTFAQAFPEWIDSDFHRVLTGVYNTGFPQSRSELQVSFDENDGPAERVALSLSAEPLKEDGIVRGVMLAAVELSDRATAQLAVERANAERQELLKELDAADRAKDEFFAMLGHELRNPLSPIVSGLGLMRLKNSGKLNRELEVIERHVTRVVRLVDDLLDVSSLTRGKIDLRKGWVELSTVVANAIEMASFLLERRSIVLTVRVQRTGLRLRVDQARLAQVVANLLTNAARNTHFGGNIWVTVSKGEEEIILSVKDDGVGIAPDVLPNIFDRFGKIGTEVDRTERGLGIGLSLVKNLVQLHGGRVSATSRGTGQGSEFCVHLPAVSKTTSSELPAFVPPPATAEAKRVLVVDDNTDAAEVLGEILRSFGHEVTVATSPLAALEVAPAFAPDVAILDIGLPIMDGYTLGRELRSKQACANCKLIALTGYGQKSDKARSAAAGFQAHLVKPVSIQLLQQLLTD